MAEELIPFTRDGYQVLQDELHHLKHIDRPKVIQDIADARAHGDLSENAEYHAARERQGFIEGRIAELEGSLSRANIIDFSADNEARSQVRFGAYDCVVVSHHFLYHLFLYSLLFLKKLFGFSNK